MKRKRGPAPLQRRTGQFIKTSTQHKQHTDRPPSFAATKDQWLRAIATDLAFSQRATTVRVAILLALFTNYREFQEGGQLICWPSTKLLGRILQAKEVRAIEAVEALVDGGYVTVDRNRFVLATTSEQSASVEVAQSSEVPWD